jgi:predicted enzyme related to lactoylglutathione lyase
MGMTDHKIVHWELMGPDGDAMKRFYEGLFGWKTEPVPGFDAYHMVAEESSGLTGAIGKGGEQMLQYQAMYVQVANVDEHLAKAEGLGGKTVMPRTVVPGIVTFGMLTDPAGNMVGVVEEETPAAE